MKINEKLLKGLSITILIVTILALVTLAHYIYTRNLISTENELLDSYNYNLFLIFIIAFFAGDKLKAKYIKILSAAGGVISFLSLVFFTVGPKFI